MIKRKRTTFKPDADTTIEKMLATVEWLRLKEGYTGYIHRKLIPGASFEYIERAVVGAVGESDRELLETVQRAHRELGLWRAYFSASHPSTPLPRRTVLGARRRSGGACHLRDCLIQYTQSHASIGLCERMTSRAQENTQH